MKAALATSVSGIGNLAETGYPTPFSAFLGAQTPFHAA